MFVADAALVPLPSPRFQHYTEFKASIGMLVRSRRESACLLPLSAAESPAQ